MVSSTDHISGLTGATVAVNLSKAGATGAAAAGVISEVDSTHNPGLYKIALTTTDTNTLGDLAFHASATGGDPTDFVDQVVAFNPLDSVRMGLTALPNAAAAANGGLPTVDATNSVKIQTPAKRNTALGNFPFVMLNTSGNPQTGLSVTAQRNIDGAGFSACANAVTEIANGWYSINLAAGDLNGTTIALRFTAAAARDTNVSILTLP